MGTLIMKNLSSAGIGIGAAVGAAKGFCYGPWGALAGAILGAIAGGAIGAGIGYLLLELLDLVGHAHITWEKAYGITRSYAN